MKDRNNKYCKTKKTHNNVFRYIQNVLEKDETMEDDINREDSISEDEYDFDEMDELEDDDEEEIDEDDQMDETISQYGKLQLILNKELIENLIGEKLLL